MAAQQASDAALARSARVDTDERRKAGLSNIAAACFLEDAPLDPIGDVAAEAVAEFQLPLRPELGLNDGKSPRLARAKREHRRAYGAYLPSPDILTYVGWAPPGLRFEAHGQDCAVEGEAHAVIAVEPGHLLGLSCRADQQEGPKDRRGKESLHRILAYPL
jgi:hypothetical protein